MCQLRDPSLVISDAFIDGEWVHMDNTFPVYEPSTGEILSSVANVTKADFIDAINSATPAQADFYESTTGPQRGRLLRAWFDRIQQNMDDLATLLSYENGKTYMEAKGEVEYAASFVRWFAEEASRTYGDTIPSQRQNTVIMTIKQPVGVCGIITPWNFPAAMVTRKVAPALAAGCSVVIKPPSETPHTCLALVKLAVESGIPGKCIQVCPTRDRLATLELATNPKIAKISFTGSTGVGKILAELATKTLKKVSLELGGNAPFIVFNDADIDTAVEGAMASKFRCSGQTCVCANRLLVQEGIAAKFTAALVARVEQLKVGPGMDKTTTQGPLVNAAAVNKVREHVEDAVFKGAKVATGGRPPNSPGFFYPPTVVTGVTKEMKVFREETFGPLAPIITFKTEAEAVELANDTETGLSGYFFTRDVNRALRVGRRLQCGMVGVNTGNISACETPFGGIKESGYGREGSKYGMDEYQVIKAITIGNIGV
ncbi:Aldehyde/histidinol dehydrogenase [Aspergillus keveii]|uniref:Aldehyde/histidinol dehydrogenase n=1 Tax=Aspergillus keveii TaxID=714993 RepID=A0ABR4G493_9EURO